MGRDYTLYRSHSAVSLSPASILHRRHLRYARELATNGGVADKCTFVQQDVRALDVAGQLFDAAMLIYGQLAVMTVAEAQQLLTTIASALKPGGVLVRWNCSILTSSTGKQVVVVYR